VQSHDRATPLAGVGGNQRLPAHSQTIPDITCTANARQPHTCTNNTRFESNMDISVAHTSTGGCTCRSTTEPPHWLVWVGTRDYLLTRRPYLTLHAQPTPTNPTHAPTTRVLGAIRCYFSGHGAGGGGRSHSAPTRGIGTSARMPYACVSVRAAAPLRE
jgi:hypothetical protein